MRVAIVDFEIANELALQGAALQHTADRKLQDPLALRLLNGAFAEGDAVLAGVQGDDIVFTKRVAATAV